MRNLIYIGNEPYISYEKLQQVVSKKTIDNGVSLKKNGKAECFNQLTLGDSRFFQVSALSKQTLKKLGTLDRIALEDDLSKLQTEKIEATKYSSEILLILEFAYTQKRLWLKYIPLYQDRFYTTEELVLYCKTHSVISAIFGLQNEGYKLKEIYACYNSLREKVILYNFDAGSYDYFCKRLTVFQSNKLEIALIHGNKHKEKRSKKRSKLHEKLMIKFYAQPHPNLLTYQEILDKVNAEVKKRGLKEIKLTTVKDFLGNPTIQNTYKPFRLGEKWAETHLEPYLNRSLPKDVHDKWEIDGKCLPFYVLLDENEGVFGRMWLIIVVDVHSRKILGFSLGRYETKYTCLEAYRSAIVNTQSIPFEIVRDNAKAYHSDLMITFEELLQDKFPIIIRPAVPGNAKDKGTVEAVIKILQDKYFRTYVGFLADGGSGVREEFRVEPALLKEYYKKHNAKSPTEIKEIVEEIIKMYNETVF